MSKQSVSRTVDRIIHRIANFLGSGHFFSIILILAAVQGIWYALSFQPTIFDEGVHIGFSAAYTHQLTPFITRQPMGLDWLGDVTRAPSYLYYYLMSWPLRLVSVFTANGTARIIFLRFVNVGLFVGGVFMYHKVVQRLSASRTVANLTMLFLILTPTFSVLGGAVNYDNLVFPLSALLLWWALDVLASQSIDATRLTWLVVLAGLGALAKIEFLALAVPVVGYVGYDLWRRHRHALPMRILGSFRRLSRLSQVACIALLLLTAGLFIERDGYNLVAYHDLWPPCAAVLSEERCLSNYSEARNIYDLKHRPAGFKPATPFDYMLAVWIPGMIRTQNVLLPNRQPSLPVMGLLYSVAALGGGTLVLVYLRDFWKKRPLQLGVVALIGYCFVLAFFDYKEYVRLADPVAVTGRYLLPIMPIFIMLVCLSMARLFRNGQRFLVVLTVFILLGFTQGGGALTYVVTDNNTLEWRSSVMSQPNRLLKRIGHKLIIESGASNN